jgi:hypothetical protein
MDKLKNAFINAKYEPNVNLANNVWQKIIIRNKRIMFIKSSIFSLLGGFSLAGLIPVSRSLVDSFTRSGFYEYLSLLFSNNNGLAYYWKELAYSLAESLPVLNLISVFVLILILFLSLKYLAKQIIKNSLSIKEFRTLSY